MSILLFLLACRTVTVDQPACPSNSESADGCQCVDGYYGEISWSDQQENWVGECISGLDMAVQTGDPSYLETGEAVLEAAIDGLQESIDSSSAIIREIYQDDGVYYEPSEWSNHIQTVDIDNNFILIQGSETGYSLASAGQKGETRYAAFGMNVVVSLDDGGNASFQVPFSRLISWLLTGVGSEDTTPDYSIGLSSIGWYQDQTMGYFSGLFDTVEDCDQSTDRASCYQAVDLIVIGAEGAEEDAETIAAELQEAMDNGTAVLFLHTETWTESEQGRAILSELGMSYGGYGGNYWAVDKAEWDDVDDMIALGGASGSMQTMLQHFELQDYSFDWSGCTEFVGQIQCDDVEGFRAEFLNGAQTLRGGLANMDTDGVVLFQEEGRYIWKLLSLLGDVYRREIQYPMSKTDADIMPFMQSYYADHSVFYHRDINPKQEDLGTFSASIDQTTLSLESLEVEVQVSKYGGYTAIGHYVLPGETFYITRTDQQDLSASVLINTQRTGSTREFNDGQYDRPKFLQSPAIPLPVGEQIAITTPYGGTLQLSVPASEDDSTLTLELEQIGSHPMLDYAEEPSRYLGALDTTLYPFTEIRTPYVQIHSKVDMMQTAIDEYNGDIEIFFEELQYYMIEDTYNLAGFQGDGLALNSAVLGFCDERGWDCEAESIHGRPALQHINVDTYAHCGGGCSGNPYDQSWPLGPLGWGETHEIGHNLQRSRLKIHGGRSSEVSNQIFPLHKHVTYYADTGISLSEDRVAYQDVFEILQESMLQEDPTSYVYENIWASEGIYDNNSERMTFYMQVVHCNDALEFLETGWDIYTLMYLHERLFTQALNDWENHRDILGFDQYSEPPSDISGNDFMLISMSYISQKDQRPFFELWGIDYTPEASTQVEAYDFEQAEKIFYPNDNANIPPEEAPIQIDGESLWSVN